MNTVNAKTYLPSHGGYPDPDREMPVATFLDR